MIALSTPGYCTFTATIRPSRMHRPVHLADRRGGHRHRVPVEEHCRGRRRALRARPTGQARRHRRDVGLQRRERGLRLGRQAVGDERHHLARLHDDALHVAELPGDVFGASGWRTCSSSSPARPRWPGGPHLHHPPLERPPGGQAPDPGLAFEAVPALLVRRCGHDGAGHDRPDAAAATRPRGAGHGMRRPARAPFRTELEAWLAPGSEARLPLGLGLVLEAQPGGGDGVRRSSAIGLPHASQVP